MLLIFPGPQLNNYADLVELIRKADESQAEPLTEHEERILTRITVALKSDQAVYRAAHKEQVYTSRKNGELIPYTEAVNMAAV
ncbi:MAG: hypothetical protein AB1512_03790 [Thermodesulfobacteriota bacterium]